MQVVHWPGRQAVAHRCEVITLGVFDGVHRGHCQVIRQVVAEARKRSYMGGVVTFDRNPAHIVARRPRPAITSLEHRLRLFAGLGVDLCVVVDFDEAVAGMAPRHFVQEVFHDLLGCRLIVLGFDCRFGRNREGDVELCRALGTEMGFEVLTVPPVVVGGQPVHSTAIRHAIQAGDLARAESLLGRPYSLYGTVVPGDGRGHDLGYPTANLDLHNEAMPPDGVYACWVFTNDQPEPGVLSVGRRETLHPEPRARRVVEVHVLGYKGDLYGRNIEVQPVTRLRAQIAFADTRELAEQIGQDVRCARARLLAMEGRSGARNGGQDAFESDAEER